MSSLIVNSELALAPHRDAYEQMAMGGAVVRHALTKEAASDLRERLDTGGFTPFRLAHRGHFEHQDRIEIPELTEGIVDLAERVTQVRLKVLSERCLRLKRGDYLLSSVDDAQFEFRTGARVIDVIADLSESSSGEAQVVYAHKGQHFFAAPQLSRSVTVIERRASVTRYHRYLNHQIQDRVVYRHCVTLTLVRPTDPPATEP